MLRGVGNAVAVQLFKRLPWLAERWARRHRFVEATVAPWARVTKTLEELHRHGIANLSQHGVRL